MTDSAASAAPPQAAPRIGVVGPTGPAASAEHAVLFSRVGTLMSRGEQLLAAEPGTRREMVDRLRECDMTWLDLGELRDRVRAV